MRHPLGDRMPLLIFLSGLPQGTQLVDMRASGSLGRLITAYRERGYVPCVEMGWHWSKPGAVAMARALRDAGVPVYVLIPTGHLIEDTAWRGQLTDVRGPDASKGGRVRDWPCLPEADPSRAVADISEKLDLIHAEGIDVTGVFLDEEGLPHPWNGIYEATRVANDCASKYPPGVLDNWDSFAAWTYELRARIFDEVFVAPTEARWPRAVVGNYADYELRPEHQAAAGPWTDRTINHLGTMDVQMPALYANGLNERRWLPDEAKRTPKAVDRVHFTLCLARVSLAGLNKRPGTRLIPYLGRKVGDVPGEQVVGMSSAAFRELARHGLLRGTDTFFLFGPAHADRQATPEDRRVALESFEDVRVAYDEALSFREFLDSGEPMTFAYPKMPASVEDWPGGADPVTVWSGLRLEDRCLIRAFTMEDEEPELEIEPWPGVKVKVRAEREPEYLIVHRDGRVEAARAEK